ncbi:MAG: bile acid:sodium symporter, partial [Leptospiraceae bacterium]|nr:bile acid:sodium symporter [Leptospiraceae bacterium]
MIDLQSLSISILVVSMLFSTGLKLAPGDLLLIFSNKLATVTALLFNLVLFPFIVYRIGIELNLSLPVMTGLTLLAAAPGGPTGPVFAGIARGHLGYAAGLMVFLSFISVFSAPATVVLILKKSLPDGIFISLLLKLVMFQLLPLLAGMGLRNYQKATAEKIYNPVSK